MLEPRLKTVRVNAVCRTCSLSPAVHPSQCANAAACFTNGPQAQRRAEASALPRARGQGVRKVIRYEGAE